MKIRDCLAMPKGDNTEYIMPSCGMEIIGENGQALFVIRLMDDVLEIRAGPCCRHYNTILTEELLIQPRSANAVEVERRDET